MSYAAITRNGRKNILETAPHLKDLNHDQPVSFKQKSSISPILTTETSPSTVVYASPSPTELYGAKPSEKPLAVVDPKAFYARHMLEEATTHVAAKVKYVSPTPEA